MRMKPIKKEHRLMSLTADDKFQLVNVKKKKVVKKDLLVNSNLCNMRANSASVKVVCRGDTTMGTERAKVSFHLASIPRPQDVYRIMVNNVNEPFEHVWLQMSEDGSRLIHPLENFSVFNFVDINVWDIKPVRPPAVEFTPFKLVQEVHDLKELVARLQDTSEFAVDLEHNQYRSFQGLTCLMQISTRTEDFIVDTLKLRIHIGPYLCEIFKDPTKKKVMHGADKDILWLQRDFGIYVCNMFDTGQASRVLRMERNSLEYLLLYFCGISANKKYQTADWRLRPLTDEMLRYAREDTHYLLHIYDVMRIMLVLSSPDPNFPQALLLEVYQRSYGICMQLYQKDVLTEYSYLNIYGLHAADFNGQQLAIVAGLCEWRDIVARAEDESTGYILPNKSLIKIAKHMPVTTGDLRRLLKFKHPHVERNLGSVVSIIQHSMQNAAAFENVANQLKHEHLQMEAVRMATKMYEEALFSPIGAGAHSCSRGVANQFGNEVGSPLARINRNHQPEGCSVRAGGNWDVMNRSVLTSIKASHYGSGPSCWVQKDRRSCGFGIGTMPGNAAGNQKFDRGKKAMEETRFKQIKPFSSFAKKFKPPHSAMKEPANAHETPNDQEHTATSSKLDHITNFHKSGSVTAEEKHDREENLSDLSSSFQKSLQMKTAKPEEGGGGGLSEVEQFDRAAAGKEARDELGMAEQGFPATGNEVPPFG
ncbi:hypothetical protein L6452_24451 [Arctium lappa]|uniref:Uncharacterized protein n=1 Tax=Arctium lappa TaxID=4217 RepID=A0ACB9A9I3_ARCLA|nr:hypothetical protein L6452_24451 [Arctium lappa]